MTGGKHRQEGHSMTEIVLVMALLLFFGTASFTLLMAGHQASEKAMERQSAQDELRIAAAYLNTRLRQHDQQGAVSIQTIPGSAIQALVIEEEYYGAALQTWIYLSDGALREVLTVPEGMVDDAISFEIARVDSFDFHLKEEGRSLSFEFTRTAGPDMYLRKGYYHLKTAQR